MTGALHVEILERYFIWFLRLLAVVYFLLGLQQWLLILDVPHTGLFMQMNMPQQAASGFFAVVNLVASVGLWLTSSWGSVVWLVAALCDIVLHGFFPELAMTPRFMLIFHSCSMLMYVFLVTQLAKHRSA
jgi:uncharacterized membrane protein (DUF2068 family)